MHGEMLTYGLKEGTSDVLIYIDDAPNGKGCGCVCPNCKHELIARNGGEKKTHHFAHYMGAECGKARMTALHMLAQNILARDKKVMLPAYKGDYFQADHKVVEFDAVNLEVTSQISEEKQLRPDSIGVKYDSNNYAHQLWVEIYVTHEIDEVKKKYIKESAKACIEIDFRDLLKTDYKESDVIARLESDISHKEWICCPAWDKVEEAGRLKAQALLEEQQRREAEERLQELERIKAEREYDEYLEQLAKEWRSNPDQNIVNAIIGEIKRNPYDFIDKSMYSHLVPWQYWLREYTIFPRNKEGLQVFYCLIHYYYNNIKLDDRKHTRWKVIDTPMWKLINQKERSDEDNVLLEYMIVLWAINLLNNHKRYSDRDSELAKVFSKNANIRKGLMEIMLQGGDRSRFLEEDVREKIRQEFGDREDGETIVQIFEICFPINIKKKNDSIKIGSNVQSDASMQKNAYEEPIRYDSDAWAKLNDEFKRQEIYYK